MNIGSKIKALRLEKGLRQEELAERLHVTRQSVSNWENNRNYPDLSTLVEITKMFDLTIDELIKEDSSFVRETDANKRRAIKGRKWIWILSIVILLMSFGIAWFVTHTDVDKIEGIQFKNKTGDASCCLGCALFAQTGIVNLEITEKTPDCELLEPMDRSAKTEEAWELTYVPNTVLDFKDKTCISSGKFGFRHELIIEKTCKVSQEVYEDIGLENFYYGIYADSDLHEPLIETNMGEMLKISNKIEREEADFADYPEYHDSHEIQLEPGTYYVAVYTTKATDEQMVFYESWMRAKREEQR